MTDRDTFAAAALTGLLGGPGDKDFSMDYWARHAYEAADAMLRERERVTEPMPKEKRAEVSSAPVFSDKAGSWPVSYDKSDEKRVFYDTNHDAALAAIATKPDSGAADSAIPDCGTSDICGRLRGWFKAVNAVPATDLMDEAADEIERLRNGALDSRETVQQEPVAWARYDVEGEFRNVYTPNEYEGGRIAWAGWGCTFVPLYRSPDAERLANARLSAANVALIAERDSLREAVRRLLDNINDRYPTKKPREWSCPNMQALDDMTYGAGRG